MKVIPYNSVSPVALSTPPAVCPVSWLSGAWKKQCSTAISYTTGHHHHQHKSSMEVLLKTMVKYDFDFSSHLNLIYTYTVSSLFTSFPLCLLLIYTFGLLAFCL